MSSKAVKAQSSSPIALVKAGQRFAFDGASGSSDALAIARYHAAYRESVPLLTVVTASAVDAQRLAAEIPYFAPDARVRQGMLESSNVRPIVEITRMMEVTRAYESMTRLVESETDLARRTVERMGRVQ